MKKILLLLISALFIMSCEKEQLEVSQDTVLKSAVNGEKVTLYHFDDEENQWVLISVSVNALKAHLAHGDYETTYVPDDNFEQRLFELGYDLIPNDDYVPTAFIACLEEIKLSGAEISNATGIQDFVKLHKLFIDRNNLEQIDLSNNLLLDTLICSGNKIMVLDLSENTMLKYLQCSGNLLETLDLSSNELLEYLYCSRNMLEHLNLSGMGNLVMLNCNSNRNTLKTIDVSNCPKLEVLSCGFCFSVETIKLEECVSLITLNCNRNNISYLDVSTCPNLNVLRCAYNQLSCLNISNTKLSILMHNMNPTLDCIQVNPYPDGIPKNQKMPNPIFQETCNCEN